MKCGGDQLSCPPSSRRGKTANDLRGWHTSCPIRMPDSRFPPRPTPSPRPSTCLQHMPEKTWEMDAQAPPRAGPSCYPMSAPLVRPGLTPAQRFVSCQGSSRSSTMRPRSSAMRPRSPLFLKFNRVFRTEFFRYGHPHPSEGGGGLWQCRNPK